MIPTGKVAFLTARTVFSAILALIALTGDLHAWNNSEINWKKIDTEHFSVHFHDGSEYTAMEAARIAEDIYEPIITFYGYRMDRVRINIFDKQDEASGRAMFYLNRIDIDASDFEFQLRGTADWLRNVLTHEFTHMVTIQTAMKMPRWLPAVFLQGISFEKEKRPDVITGYPNFQGSVPLSGEIVPNWLAEGVAQYQCRATRSDIWDSHRDMILRTSVLGDGLLTLDEMGVFGKNSLDAEKVYNQGFSMVTFISQTYGEGKLSELLKELSPLYRLAFDGACKKVLGIGSGRLYSDWKAGLERRYRAVEEAIGKNMVEGEKVAGKGFMNLYPIYGPDAGDIYFLSNEGGEGLGVNLVRRKIDGRLDRIADDLSSRPSISSGGGMICFSRRTGDNEHGYEINDIFVVELVTGRERRVTRGMRAVDPVFSPDSGSVAAVRGKDGAEWIEIVDLSSGESRPLTTPRFGERYYGLSWGKSGILASRFSGLSRDIVMIIPGSGEVKILLDSEADERDAAWDEGGGGFFYSSDRSGIFNIYHRDIMTGSEMMVTNVIGGAFAADSRGKDMVFSAYGPGGYEIRELRNWRESALGPSTGIDDSRLVSERILCNTSRSSAGSTGMYPVDTVVAGSKGYSIEYTPLYIFPRVMVYDGKFRLGVALDSRDYLDRQAVFAAASINMDREYNLQFGFETRQWKPTYSFDFMAARKYYDYSEADLGDVEYRYDLWDAFFTCTFELDKPSALMRKEIALQYNHGEYGVNINAWKVAEIEMGWNYYKANEVTLLARYADIAPGVDSDVNPRSGRKLNIEVTRAWDELSSGEFEYNFKPIYDKNEFGRYQLEYEEYIPLPFWDHALSVYMRGGAIDESVVDDFFNLYLGSADGLRGYSYYSLGGRKVAMGRITYRFPLWRNMNRQIPGIFFGSIYSSFFFEAGKAWNEDTFDLRGNSKDAGLELRLKGFTFYSYPLAASFTAAYGLEQIIYTDPFNADFTFREGKEWKFYGTVLFDF